MKIVVMPDKFKGTLKSEEATEAIVGGIEAVIGRRGRIGIEVIGRPLADGGDGTLYILTNDGERQRVMSYDARMRSVDTEIGIKMTGGVKHGIIESATSIGLSRLRRAERNPELTTSYGLGVQIRRALEAGCTKLTIAIGGTATNDCGAGMLSALGVRFYDACGSLIEYPCGKDLIRISDMDLCGITELFRGIEIEIMCDVDNPLLGSEGATMVFGQQKGADQEMLLRLEAGVKRYSELMTDIVGKDIRMQPGSGAAGGIGWALRMISEAHYTEGAATVSKFTGVDEAIQGAVLLVTGEGKCDGASMHSKVVGHVAKLGREHDIPVLVLCGMRDGKLSEELVREAGINSIHALTEYVTHQEAFSHPHEALTRMTETVFEQIL